jgi:hypothetical protein
MKKLIYITLLYLICSQLSIAQDDSIIVSTGMKDSIDMKYDRIYKLFIQDKSHDVRHLWKVNLAQLGFESLNMGYEQKIGKNWSNETYLLASYSIDRLGHNLYYYGINLNDQIKYYYNLGRRQRLGKNINAFGGDYFGIGGSFGLYYFDTSSLVYHTNPDNYLNTSYQAYIRYGLQRRIGNIGFFEVYAGINYWYYKLYKDIPVKQDLISPEIGLKLGFAIESFSNLKRMLR